MAGKFIQAFLKEVSKHLNYETWKGGSKSSSSRVSSSDSRGTGSYTRGSSSQTRTTSRSSSGGRGTPAPPRGRGK